MVAAVRRGQSLRAVAREFAVGVATVAHWVERAKDRRLDRVDWSDRPRAPHKTRRTDTSLEDLILKTRADLAQRTPGPSPWSSTQRSIAPPAASQRQTE